MFFSQKIILLDTCILVTRPAEDFGLDSVLLIGGETIRAQGPCVYPVEQNRFFGRRWLSCLHQAQEPTAQPVGPGSSL